MDFGIMISYFLIGLIIPIGCYLNDMFFGNTHDGEFSDGTLKNLTVKQNSIFRKIMPFKEFKGSVCPKYLYIRIIPLVVHIFLFLILVPLFIIDQLWVNIMNDDIFGYIGIVSLCGFVLYNFIVAILARIF